MKHARLYIPIGIVLLLLVSQAVPVKRDNPPVTAELRAPDDVKSLLKNACYDCHSNETKWPVYSRIAPVSWLVAHDVKEAREHLNFSDWTRMEDDARSDALRMIAKEVGRGDMPDTLYKWMHVKARLTGAERKLIVDWAIEARKGDGAGNR